MIQIASSIAQNEGYRTFYRGISAPLLAEAPKRAGKFMFNEQFKKIWVQWLPPARFGPLPFVLSGAYSMMMMVVVTYRCMCRKS